MITGDAHIGQIDIEIFFCTALQAITPALRHIRDDIGGSGKGSCQGILETAVNDALRCNSLAATKGITFKKDDSVSFITQSIE